MVSLLVRRVLKLVCLKLLSVKKLDIFRFDG